MGNSVPYVTFVFSKGYKSVSVYCVCPNLVSKVQPFLRTSSDVVRLSGSLHHGHGLSLANVTVEIAAFSHRPLPCHIPGKHISSMCKLTCTSVCFCMYMCLPDEEDMVTHIPFLLGPPLVLLSSQF